MLRLIVTNGEFVASLCGSAYSDRAVVWRGEWGGPRHSCVRWASTCLKGRGCFCDEKAGWIRIPFWDGELGRSRDGCRPIRWGGDRRRGRAVWRGEFGSSHCITNRDFVCSSVRAMRSSQMTLGRTCYLGGKGLSHCSMHAYRLACLR